MAYHRDLEYPYYDDESEWKKHGNEFPRFVLPEADDPSELGDDDHIGDGSNPWMGHRTAKGSNLPLPEPPPYPPENEWEALLLGAELPDRALHDLLGSLVDALPERERYVIEGLFYEKLSLRQLGRRMSLSYEQVRRIRDQAIDRLRERLEP